MRYRLKVIIMTRLLPLAAMEQIIKESGAERVSEDAKAALKEVLEKIANDISTKAVQYAKHAGRSTVKDRDIKLAVKE